MSGSPFTTLDSDNDPVTFAAEQDGQGDLIQVVSIDGTVPISGTVTATASGTQTISDGGGSITVDDGAGSLTVDGTVAVSSVSGSVAVTDNGGTLSIDDGAGSITVDGTGLGIVGAAAHDAAVSGNPVLVAGYASSAAPSAVAAGDVARAWLNLRGATIIAPLPVTATESTVSVTTSSGTLLASLATRTWLSVRNTSDNPSDIIYLSLAGGTATTSSSIAIPGGNGGANAWEPPVNQIVTGAITCIGTGTITAAVVYTSL